jgi:hypothetical protein
MRHGKREMTFTRRVGRIDGITKAHNRSTPDIFPLTERVLGLARRSNVGLSAEMSFRSAQVVPSNG